MRVSLSRSKRVCLETDAEIFSANSLNRVSSLWNNLAYIPGNLSVLGEGGGEGKKVEGGGDRDT